MTPFWSAVLQAPVTALGGIFHNWLVKKFPNLSGGFKVGNGALGYLGLAGAGIGAALDLQKPPSTFGSLANCVGSGFLTEGLNMPGVEGLVTIPTLKAAQKTGVGGPGVGYGLSPYVTSPHVSTLGQGIF